MTERRTITSDEIGDNTVNIEVKWPGPVLAELLQEAISLKNGNKELALFYVPPKGREGEERYTGWVVEIGNPVSAVMLGESSGEFGSEYHPTPEAAVQDLIDKLSGVNQ